jgi:tryptophan synthase alpha chain
MSRIEKCFASLREQNRKALIPYVTAGDPNPTVTVPLMHAMVKAGANLLELGVPFSDPMADGPVIQAASERALEHHVSLNDVLDMVRAFREKDQDTPVILMGYLNPIEVMGYEHFASKATEAGVDGILTVDLPPEESGEFQQVMSKHGLDPIYLVAPTSTEARVRKICAAASGFVYYVSLKGVTGAANLDVASVKEKVQQIRAISDLPIGVGFGIKDAESAAKVSAVADAVVVGSAIVNRVAAHVDNAQQIEQDVSEVLASMRAAMDA